MVRIQNIYYMLAYAFNILESDEYKALSSESFEHALDLYAAILSIGINQLIKRGMGKEYIEITEQTSNIAGKILISDSIKKNTQTHRKLICTKDDFSIDSYLNQILKSVTYMLLKRFDVSKKYKRELRKYMSFFSSVKTIDVHHIAWHKIQFHRHNQIYRMLINICYLTIKGLVQNDESGKLSLINFMDNQQLYKLYERFILKFYQKHYPDLKVQSSFVNWNVDDEEFDLLPRMKTDVTLTYNDKTLIIDAKMYKDMLQKYYGSEKQHSSNMYQIYTYVKNADKKRLGNVEGMLLYARTDEDNLPDKTYYLDGSKIMVRSLDLNTDFKEISDQLNNIVYNNY